MQDNSFLTNTMYGIMQGYVISILHLYSLFHGLALYFISSPLKMVW